MVAVAGCDRRSKDSDGWDADARRRMRWKSGGLLLRAMAANAGSEIIRRWCVAAMMQWVEVGCDDAMAVVMQ